MAEAPRGSMQEMLRRRASPALFAAMERESRLWQAACPHCGARPSIWEMGGVRYRAAGEPRKRMRCPRCGRTDWMRVRWTGGDAAALGPRPSVAPFLLKILLVTTIIPLLILAALLFAVLR